MNLAKRIQQLSGRAACVLTASGSTAILASLKILGERHGPGEVIVPSITCPAVVQAILHAGFTPVFADVTVPECTIDPLALAPLANNNTRAIVPIHIFGNAAPIDRIVEFAQRRKIAVIEDAAQAMGGMLDGRPFGSFGDFSIYSFGSKIVSAGGGGALLTDDLDAAKRARQIIDSMPLQKDDEADTSEALLTLSERNLYHALYDLLRANPSSRVGAAFRNLVPAYESLFLKRLAPSSAVPERIEIGLDELERNLSHRCSIAQAYKDGLTDLGDKVRVSDGWRRSGVVWRCTLVFKEIRDAIVATNALRQKGIHASNHYWSVAQMLYDQHLPNSSYLSPRLLNLWVDSTISNNDVNETVAIIRSVL